jgi:hypothetical protein
VRCVEKNMTSVFRVRRLLGTDRGTGGRGNGTQVRPTRAVDAETRQELIAKSKVLCIEAKLAIAKSNVLIANTATLIAAVKLSYPKLSR